MAVVAYWNKISLQIQFFQFLIFMVNLMNLDIPLGHIPINMLIVESADSTADTMDFKHLEPYSRIQFIAGFNTINKLVLMEHILLCILLHFFRKNHICCKSEFIHFIQT